MKNPFDHPAWIDISLLVGRLTMGLYMALAGWNKITGPGVTAFVNGPYKKLTPAWLPELIAKPYGYALPFAELLLGVLLIIGLLTRWSAGLIVLMLLSILVAVVSASGTLKDSDPNKPFNTVLIMIGLSMILMVVGSGRLALDPLYFTGGNRNKE